jgi:hypothetical protein
VGDVAGGEGRPGAPGLVPQAPGLQKYGVPPPVLVRVELGPVYTAVLHPRVVRVLKKEFPFIIIIIIIIIISIIILTGIGFKSFIQMQPALYCTVYIVQCV